MSLYGNKRMIDPSRIIGGVGGTVPGSNTEIIFNDSGAFGSSANFTYNGTVLYVSGTIVPTVALSAPNYGLRFLDSTDSYLISIGTSSTLTADRQLTIVTGDANRTLTLSGNTTLSGGTHSGTNTGDNAVNTLYSGLVSNATHTGDVTGSTALTIANDAVTTAKILDGAVTFAKADEALQYGTELYTGGDFPCGPLGIQAGTNGTITLDKLFALRTFIGKSQTFNRISVNQLGTASSFIRLGIYDDDNGKPGALLHDFGQVSTSASGEASIAISVTLSGHVWVCAVGQGVAPSTTRLGTAVVNRDVAPSNHYSTSFTATAISQSSVSGALPSPWGATYNREFTANTVPMIWLRPS